MHIYTYIPRHVRAKDDQARQSCKGGKLLATVLVVPSLDIPYVFQICSFDQPDDFHFLQLHAHTTNAKNVSVLFFITPMKKYISTDK